MENCIEAKTVVDSVVISKDHMWRLSQDVLFCFSNKMTDFAIPDNASFLKFSEICHEILRNQDAYSWSDAKKFLQL